RVHVAVKAGPYPEVLEHLIRRHGLFGDAASDHEARLLGSLGLAGDSIILSHPRKDEETLEAMRELRVGFFTVDSVDELDKANEAGIPSADYRPVVLVRFRTESKGIQDNLSRKFGCRLEEVPGILAAA